MALIKSFLKIALKTTGLDKLLGRITHYGIRQAISIYPDTLDVLTIAQNDNRNNQIIEQLNLKDKGIHLNGHVYISHPLMLRIGKNVHVGNNAYLFTKGGLTIGDNTHISRNLTIYTANHQYEGETLPYDDNYIEKPVFIGKNVWIGMNVCIVPGITIGDGAVIGMGTIVSKNVSECEIVGSAPQKIIKKRNEEHYQKLNLEKRFGGINGKPLRTDEYYKLGKNATALGEHLIFAVGTGRCGSTTLAKVLNQHPDIDFRHEPNGQLIKLSTDYAHGELSREEVKRRLKLMYDQTLTTKKVYGEADHKLFNLIEILIELYPKAKFIWQIRNAFDTVNSTFNRGMFHDKEFNFPVREELNVDSPYTDNLYPQNRLNGHLIGDFTIKQWQDISPIERNCWYWSYVNSKIEDQLSNVDDSQIFMLKIESLGTQTPEIFAFIKIRDFITQDLPAANKATYDLTLNKKQSSLINESMNKWCSNLMKKWYS